jgi:hypothetical protein
LKPSKNYYSRLRLKEIKKINEGDTEPMPFLSLFFVRNGWAWAKI